MADFTSRFNELLTRTPDNDTALAEALGVSKQTISAWKNGARFPKRPTVSIIASYFGVGVPWLQGVTDDESAGIEYNAIKVSLGSNSPAAQKLRAIGEQLAPHTTTDTTRIELMELYERLNSNGRESLLKYARFLNTDPDMKKDGASNDATA